MAAPLLPTPEYRRFRVALLRIGCRIVIGGLLRIRVEHRERFAAGPAIYCFNHLNWVDPLVLMAVMPARPRYAMFGPKEADMTRGGRNRLIAWAGFGIPYRPEKTDLRETTRRVTRVLDDGWVILIAGEGRIHRGERELLPLADGTAFFALRAGVPVVPLAINGTSWLAFRRGVRVRIGESIPVGGRPTSESVEALTAQISAALLAMTADFPDPPEPGPRWRKLTEWFNDWPEGGRPAPGQSDADGSGAGTSADRVRAGPRADPRLWHPATTTAPVGDPVGATGLSADAKEYRARLAGQPDAQIDTWAAEMLRDTAIRRGVVKVVEDFRRAAKLNEQEFERVFASGGGPPSTLGRDPQGRLMVPAVALWALVPGIRSQVADGRDRLIEYLVDSFHEIVYI